MPRYGARRNLRRPCVRRGRRPGGGRKKGPRTSSSSRRAALPEVVFGARPCVSPEPAFVSLLGRREFPLPIVGPGFILCMRCDTGFCARPVGVSPNTYTFPAEPMLARALPCAPGSLSKESPVAGRPRSTPRKKAVTLSDEDVAALEAAVGGDETVTPEAAPAKPARRTTKKAAKAPAAAKSAPADESQDTTGVESAAAEAAPAAQGAEVIAEG